MLRIKEIPIRNFRSIRNLTVEVGDVNIFTGLNDVGKSNVLKSLNLFFNGQTDIGQAFNFDVDYCLNAPVVAKKAKKIEISLKVEIPDGFKDHGLFTWTKRWQRNGSFEEVINPKFSPKSRTNVLLHRIRYRYVPAVKSTDYFRQLLRDLYVSLSSDVDGELVKKTKDYSGIIKKFTARISKSIESGFGINSSLEFPKDQSVIFRELQFVTDIEHGTRVDLIHRGDGVKSIHIPAILSFIAAKDNEGRANRSIPYTTLWGYEEPENGLEMRKCYELADTFYDISRSIQIFVTSHSPGFYSLKAKSEAKVFWLCKDPNGFTHNSVCGDGIVSLGCMPLITPYITEKMDEIQKLNELLNCGVCVDVDTILVEGVTDKDYVVKAIELYSPGLSRRLNDKTLRVFARSDDGGVSNVVGYATAWHCSKLHHRLVVLLDLDEVGRKAKQAISELHAENIKLFPVPLTPEYRTIFTKIKQPEKFSITIESLLPIVVWNVLDKKKLLQDRSVESLLSCFQYRMESDKTLKEVIEELIPENLRVYVNRVPHADKKVKSKDVVLKFLKGHPDVVMEGFQSLAKGLEERLSIDG